ncbi:hypothetical protein [Aeromonas caviae]|uniref:hypothetical protein n=1 Tax=Aeromonas caviae TaxID=648 RepID=UPI00191CE2A3|nr:hypothetical protein [Aeromonas caviae]MBL0487291.1 hypothetical protein [Aeromonas caviae]
MSYLEKKTGITNKIKSLPNYNTAGSYCFFSQCIQLDSLENEDFIKAVDLNKPYDECYKHLLKFAPLLGHEVKHWYDSHSTLWGLKLLRNIYACYNDLLEAEQRGISTPLHHFNKQLALYDSIAYIKLPEYYSTSYSHANTSIPWGYTYSTGIMFSKHGDPTDRNIFFTRFNNKSGELIARVPFSLCSLLESSAVAQELHSKVRIISFIEDPVTRKIEQNNLNKNLVREVYDENLVEYSVVAHKISNSFNIQDPLESYSIAARITRLILNLTSETIFSLRAESMLSDRFKVFFTPYNNAIKHMDYGAIFSLLIDTLYCEFQSRGRHVNNENLSELLDIIFTKHTGNTLTQVFEKSKLELESVCSPVPFRFNKEHIDSSLELGRQLHNKLGLIGDEFINLENEMIPSFILGDGTFINKQGDTAESFENRYFELTKYYDNLMKFSKACIV